MPSPPRPGPPVPALSEACPGCGAVLAPLPDPGPRHPGASLSCSRLYDVTVHGLRDEAEADPAAEPVVRLADAAYDAQHPVAADPARLDAALDRLEQLLGTRPAVGRHRKGTPPVWRSTVADVAADLDVIDLHVLVESWARAVQEDWAGVVQRDQAPVTPAYQPPGGSTGV